MKKKTIVKIVLDVLMMIVIVLMYSTRALGMGFHEIGGLILIGVFCIHNGLNFGWIRRVSSKLNKVNGRTRLMWIVDVLMLVAFLLIGLSGLLISRVAFPSLAVQGGPWKIIHYSCSAMALILVGVHLGLHFTYLKGIFSRWIKLPKVVAGALTVVLMAYGGYGVVTTSFARWLTMPFSTNIQGIEGARGQFPDMRERVPIETTSAEDTETTQTSPDTTIPQTDASPQMPSDSAPITDAVVDTSVDTASMTGAPEGFTGAPEGFTGRPEGMTDAPEGESGSLGSALQTLAQYFSITFLFAALTAFVDSLLRKKKQRPAD